MSKKILSKEESRQRYEEGRALWNEFDPIGVALPGGVEDEYDGYVGPCLRIVIERESEDGLANQWNPSSTNAWA
jgi:hypothetical protein